MPSKGSTVRLRRVVHCAKGAALYLGSVLLVIGIILV